MKFSYKVITPEGKQQSGTIETISKEAAIRSLQERRYIVVNVAQTGSEGFSVKKFLPFMAKVPMKHVVMVSRQLSTLFESQVSAVKAFSLVADNTPNALLAESLHNVVQNIQGGASIHQSMAKESRVFNDFFVNMVKAGEESGKLTETFSYLADYLERQYALNSKVKGALVYPGFVITTFIIVMALMLTKVIPNLAGILEESGQELPIYTKVVMAMSDFMVNYGIYFLLIAGIGGFFGYGYIQKGPGKAALDDLKLKLPYLKKLYTMIYLARISDNMNTMLTAGIPMVRTLEMTASVVGNQVYADILDGAVEGVKAGNSLSAVLDQYDEIPAILVQMIQVGEETGSMGRILQTLSRFYKREVENAVDTMIGLIEPAMIILLGVGVGFLLISVLMPIYNMTNSIG